MSGLKHTALHIKCLKKIIKYLKKLFHDKECMTLFSETGK